MKYLRDIIDFILFIILVFLLINSAKADDLTDTWTNTDIVKESAFISLLALDFSQTKDIKNHSNLYETNKILGDHPSNKKINNYIVESAIIHIIVADVLPSKYRSYFLNGSIAVEAVVVGNNKRIGLNFKF